MRDKKAKFWQAQNIAVGNLRSCYTSGGILAGLHHFTDFWGRDALFAALGSLTIGDIKIVRQTINTFLKYQRADGLVPYLIRRTKLTPLKYFGKAKLLTKPKPCFRTPATFSLVYDAGLLLVIVSCQYLRVTKDQVFFQKIYPRLRLIINYYQRRFGSGLISEGPLCEWADAVLKFGQVLYTNVLYSRALADMAQITGEYRTPAKLINTKLQEQFWQGQYFVDWIDWKKQHYFSSHANFLAIIFGVASKLQAEKILEFAQKHCQAGFTYETNFPRYPCWRIPLYLYLVGMADYHNRGLLWLQTGILYAAALEKVGRRNEATSALQKISQKIIEYNGVYEVYEKDGSQAKRYCYTSEHPFAWSAGLYLWVYRNYFSKRY